MNITIIIEKKTYWSFWDALVKSIGSLLPG